MRLRLIALPVAAAAMAAAPAMADDKASTWIRVQSMPLGGSMAKGNNQDDGWIEIQGWDWEVEAEASANKVDGFTVKQKVKPVRPTGTSDLTMKRGTSANPPDLPTQVFIDPPPVMSGGSGANQTITIGGARTENSGPQSRGRVKVRFPWLGCTKGQRLPSLELRDARTLYVLEGVTVMDCSAGSATFAYAGLRRSSPSFLPR